MQVFQLYVNIYRVFLLTTLCSHLVNDPHQKVSEFTHQLALRVFRGHQYAVWVWLHDNWFLLNHRADFLVASDLALRAQLTEFRDHQLVKYSTN